MNESIAPKKLVDGSRLRFQKYGVKIEVQAEPSENLEELCRRLEQVFPKGVEPIETGEAGYVFVIKERKRSKNDKSLQIYLNGERLSEGQTRENSFDFAESRIRLTVAEFASEKVFLHAGVVGWRGKALIIPAQSFAGKTTLVAELIKRGAEYYSDEYAVLDAEANVEPFPKWLSLRGIIDETRQLDRPVESLGGIAAERTIPPGMILLSKYKKGRKIPKRWHFKPLTQGAAIMELLPHTMAMRNNPKFVLEVLNKLTNRAIIVRTLRGEAAEFAEPLLGYFELQTEK